MKDLTPLINSRLPAITKLRQDIHSYPEPGFKEVETVKKILTVLKELPGIEVKTGIAQTGIVATLGQDKPGPCIALRADMDCLPIQEKTGKPYASTRPGFMHACGHDGHVACLVGAAMVLTEISDELKGPVKFIFQPAEECQGGARFMCEEGILREEPRIKAIFGLHGWPDLEVGSVATKSGPILASVDDFTITVSGKGTHAATPHQGTDPIVVAAHIVVALQSIVSRMNSPFDNAVVTIGQIQAGSATNVIPEQAKLHGTIRALDPKLRTDTFERLKRIAQHTAAAFGAEAQIELLVGYPPVVNEEKSTDYFLSIARRSLGEKAVTSKGFPVMGAEDFSFYLQEVPGCFWALGVRPHGQETYPSLHNDRYDFTDDALFYGVQLHCELARGFAQPQ